MATPPTLRASGVADVLIEEAETRTANLRAQLSWIGSGAKLCEIADQIDEQGHPRPAGR